MTENLPICLNHKVPMQLVVDGKTFMKYKCPECEHTCIDIVTKLPGGWIFERKYSWEISLPAGKPDEDYIGDGVLRYKVNNE